MSGVTIASNVVGKYYDSKDFDPFWEKAEELDVLMIMHPEWVARQRKNRRLWAAHRLRQSRRYDPLGGLHDLQRGLRSLSESEARVASRRRLFSLSSRQIRQRLQERRRVALAGETTAEQISEEPLLRQFALPGRDHRIFETHGRREHIMVGTDYPFDLGDWMAAERSRR